jgi:SAM-dependent methyltransferase
VRRVDSAPAKGLFKLVRLVHDKAMASTAVLKAAVPARYKQAARRTYLRLSALANVGSRVECPCCGQSFRKLARFHGVRDQCPACGTLMRHRALVLLLRDELQLPSTGGKVLHVGPARAVSNWISSQPTIDYVSADLDPSNAMVQADITRLPFGEGSFDFVLCIHVLEHVPDDRGAIAELHRVLRPGGRAVLQVPPSPLAETFEDDTVTDPSERERVFGQWDHVRVCGADYPERVAEAGFSVESVDYAARLDSATLERYALRAGEPFLVCTKPARAA